EVDVRLLHLPEELTGVRAQRLDVPSLPLGVDRVERQRRLAGPRESGEHDQRVARQLQREVPQVVLTGAMDNEGILAHVRRVYRGPPTRRSVDRVGLRCMAHRETGPVRPSFSDAFSFWLRLGFI